MKRRVTITSTTVERLPAIELTLEYSVNEIGIEKWVKHRNFILSRTADAELVYVIDEWIHNGRFMEQHELPTRLSRNG